MIRSLFAARCRVDSLAYVRTGAVPVLLVMVVVVVGHIFRSVCRALRSDNYPRQLCSSVVVVYVYGQTKTLRGERNLRVRESLSSFCCALQDRPCRQNNLVTAAGACGCAAGVVLRQLGSLDCVPPGPVPSLAVHFLH